MKDTIDYQYRYCLIYKANVSNIALHAVLVLELNYSSLILTYFQGYSNRNYKFPCWKDFKVIALVDYLTMQSDKLEDYTCEARGISWCQNRSTTTAKVEYSKL